MFNIIVAKPCQIFDKYLPFVQYYCAKTLSNLCQIFDKNLIQQLTQYNSGRMIYFRENSIVGDAYSDTTGIFTAPFNGTYEFTLFSIATNSGGHRPVLKVNDVILRRGHGNNVWVIGN